MAQIDEILKANVEAFKDTQVKEQYDSIKQKLEGLGYDVLINHREKAEFVPSSRLGEIAGQRDSFKTQVEQLNEQLEVMKKSAGATAEFKAEIQKLQTANENLLKESASSRISSELLVEARDAIDPKDVLKFVDMDRVKFDSKGNLKGAKEEIARIREEKPYLFTQPGRKKAGVEDQGGQKDLKTGGMNGLIRKAASRG